MEEYWLAPGTCIDGGKYRIEKVLGDGGLGTTRGLEGRSLSRNFT